MKGQLLTIVLLVGTLLSFTDFAGAQQGPMYYDSQLPDWAVPAAVRNQRQMMDRLRANSRARGNVKFAPRPAPPLLSRVGDLNSPTGVFEHDRSPLGCFTIEEDYIQGARIDVWVGSWDFVPYLVVMRGGPCHDVEAVRGRAVQQYGTGTPGQLGVAEIVFTAASRGPYKIIVNDMSDRTGSTPGKYEVAAWVLPSQ
jgi:hypothetical protein